MRFSDTLIFSWRLTRGNLGKSFLAFTGLFLGSFFLTLFLSFTEGLRQNLLTPLSKELSSEAVIAFPAPAPASGLFDPRRYLERRVQNGVSAETIRIVESWPETAKAYEEIHLPFPVATKAQVIFGIDLALDSLISGYSEEAVQKFLPPGKTFSGDEETLPVLISPLLVEIYNSTLADLLPGVNRKTLADFEGRSLEFTFGKTNYFSLLHSFPEGVSPEVKRAEIVGFAPFLSPFTLAVPDSFARRMRARYEEKDPQELLPSALLILPQSPRDVEPLREKLRMLGLQLKDPPLGFERIRTVFMGIEILLVGAGTIIFLLALLVLAVVLLAIIREQRRNIGILRALGSSSWGVRIIFFTQGMGLAILSSGCGFFLAIFFASLLNRFLLAGFPLTAIPVRSFFLFSPLFFIGFWCVLLGVSAVIIFLPTLLTGRLPPLAALKDGSS